MEAQTTSAPHTTVTCTTCGHDSCHGNYAADPKNSMRAVEVCSRCRQPLKP